MHENQHNHHQHNQHHQQQQNQQQQYQRKDENQVTKEADVKRSIIPLEERMIMFTHLLREKQVLCNCVF